MSGGWGTGAEWRTAIAQAAHVLHTPITELFDLAPLDFLAWHHEAALILQAQAPR